MDDFIANIGLYLMYLSSVVGAASIILQGISKITDITPSKKDDEYVTKAKKAVGVLVTILDRVSLQLPADKSRPPSSS